MAPNFQLECAHPGCEKLSDQRYCEQHRSGAGTARSAGEPSADGRPAGRELPKELLGIAAICVLSLGGLAFLASFAPDEDANEPKEAAVVVDAAPVPAPAVPTEAEDRDEAEPPQPCPLEQELGHDLTEDEHWLVWEAERKLRDRYLRRAAARTVALGMLGKDALADALERLKLDRDDVTRLLVEIERNRGLGLEPPEAAQERARRRLRDRLDGSPLLVVTEPNPSKLYAAIAAEEVRRSHLRLAGFLALFQQEGGPAAPTGLTDEWIDEQELALLQAWEQGEAQASPRRSGSAVDATLHRARTTEDGGRPRTIPGQPQGPLPQTPAWVLEREAERRLREIGDTPTRPERETFGIDRASELREPLILLSLLRRQGSDWARVARFRPEDVPFVPGVLQDALAARAEEAERADGDILLPLFAGPAGSAEEPTAWDGSIALELTLASWSSPSSQAVEVQHLRLTPEGRWAWSVTRRGAYALTGEGQTEIVIGKITPQEMGELVDDIAATGWRPQGGVLGNLPRRAVAQRVTLRAGTERQMVERSRTATEGATSSALSSAVAALRQATILPADGLAVPLGIEVRHVPALSLAAPLGAERLVYRVALQPQGTGVEIGDRQVLDWIGGLPRSLDESLPLADESQPTTLRLGAEARSRLAAAVRLHDLVDGLFAEERGMPEFGTGASRGFPTPEYLDLVVRYGPVERSARIPLHRVGLGNGGLNAAEDPASLRELVRAVKPIVEPGE